MLCEHLYSHVRVLSGYMGGSRIVDIPNSLALAKWQIDGGERETGSGL